MLKNTGQNGAMDNSSAYLETGGSTNGIAFRPNMARPIPNADGFRGTVGQGARPGSVNGLALLKSLKKRWLPALILGLFFGAAGAAGAWFVLSPMDEAEATIEVSGRSFILHQEVAGKVGGGKGALNERKSSMIAHAKTNIVLSSILGDPQVANLGIVNAVPTDMQVSWLKNELEVSFTAPGMMRFRMAGDQIHERKKIVEVASSMFLRAQKIKEDEEMRRYDEIYDKLIREKQVQLNSKRDQHIRMGRTFGSTKRSQELVSTLAAESFRVAKANLANVETMLVRVGSELDGVTARLQTRENRLRARNADIDIEVEGETSVTTSNYPDFSPREISEIIEDNPLMNRLRQEELVLRTERADRASRYRDENHRILKNLDLKIEKVQKRMDALRETLRPGALDRLEMESLNEMQESKKDLEAQQGRLESEKKEFEKKLKELSEQRESDWIKAYDYEQLETEIANLQLSISEAQEARRKLQNEMLAETRFALIDPARIIPRATGERKQLMGTALGGVGMFALTVLAIAWWEFRARRIDSADEVVKGLGMRVMGTLPIVPENIRSAEDESSTEDDHYWQQIFTESIDATRTMLLHDAEEDDSRVIMVTSALSGEGKTSLSAQLAASIARSGKRTLLLDADLRKPGLHVVYEVENTPGFAEYLREESDLADVIQSTSVADLCLMTAGKCDAHALQLLSRERLRRILQTLRGRFDFIIVDSSPVLPIADSMLIAQHVDGVLFSILRDVSRIPSVHSAYQRFADLGVRVLGAVVNGSSVDSYNSGYGYGYGRYGTYGHMDRKVEEKEFEPAGA